MASEPTENSKILFAEAARGKDRRHLVYWSAFYVGLATLFPWNILITVTDYWNYKLRNVTLDSRNPVNETITDLQKLYNSYLAIAANVPNAVFLILTACFGHQLNTKWLIFPSLAAMSILLAAISALAIVDTDGWQETFLRANLLLIAVLTSFNGICQAASSAVFGKFPVEIIGAVPTGAGIGGLVPALLNVLILALRADSRLTGFICFLASAAVNTLCAVVMFGLTRNAYFRSVETSLTHRPPARDAGGGSSLVSKYKDIVRHAGLYLACILITFTTTLVVFPAVVALVHPEVNDGSEWKRLYFVPVACFVLYNAFDYVGKDVATRVQLPGPGKGGQLILLALCTLRICFIPLFMFCNVAPTNRSLPVVFESEWWYVAFLAVFAFTNGYLGNIAYMFTPKVVSFKDQEMAASFAAASLVIGCGVGALISAPVVKML